MTEKAFFYGLMFGCSMLHDSMILVSGSLAYDRIMNFPGYFRDHILPEKVHVLSVSFLIDRIDEHFGGTAGNIAYTLSLLGLRPTILGSAGNDFARYRSWLKKHRIGTTHITTHRDIATASASIMTDRADNQITAFHMGAMGRKCKVQSAKIKMTMHNAKIAIVSPGNLDDMRALPRLCKRYGIPYIFDPGQSIPALSSTDLKNGISGARAVIVNDYELALVLKKTQWKKDDLLTRTEMLVTTFGEKGSRIEQKNSIASKESSTRRTGRSRSLAEGRHATSRSAALHIPVAQPKKIVDPTGAGDAYRAGFIYGLLAGWPIEHVGRFAALCAVYTVEKIGTQTHSFTPAAVRKRYRDTFEPSLPVVPSSHS